MRPAGHGGLTAQMHIAIVLRIESYRMGIGHAPLTNMYESLVFFVWCTLPCCIWCWNFVFKTRVMGAFVMPFVAVAMAYASLSARIDDQISPLIPAPQSTGSSPMWSPAS